MYHVRSIKMSGIPHVIGNSNSPRAPFYKRWPESFLKYNSVFAGAIMLYLGKQKSVYAPDYVKIETTNVCNGKCAYCPRDKMTRDLGVMEYELFSKIIDELDLWKVSSVHLQNYGEPLLDPMLIPRIKCAKSKGIKHVSLFTNGMLLTNSIAEKLIDAGLDEINISIDVCDEKKHDNLRKNIRYGEITKNLKNLVDIKKLKETPNPEITLASIIHSSNTDDIDHFITRWGGMVKEIHFQRVHDWGLKGSNKKEYCFPCLRLWTTFTILWDGRVAMCCVDYDGKYILGDVKKSKLRQIWNSDDYTRIRLLHLSPKLKQVVLCENCTLRLKDSPLWIKKILF